MAGTEDYEKLIGKKKFKTGDGWELKSLLQAQYVMVILLQSMGVKEAPGTLNK